MNILPAVMTSDAIVLAACCVMGVFSLGLEIGKQHQPLACPVVAGQTIVSTIDSKTEQLCVYVQNYGRATRRVKL